VSPPRKPSLFERLGGEATLRAIIDDFVEKIFADVMIGYFFAKADKARVKAKEYEFAARHLGLDVPYTGEPLPAVHARHDIRGGHFMRRMQLLKETLEKHSVPPEVIDHWLSHTEQMRAAITKNQGSDCTEPGQAGTSQDQRTADSPAATPPSPATTPQHPVAGKPTPSVAEIQAYLEQSAARTKLRLPLAFGSASASGPAQGAVESPGALPITRDPALTPPDPSAPPRTRALPVTKGESPPATTEPTRKPR
jgi:hemoglobin